MWRHDNGHLHEPPIPAGAPQSSLLARQHTRTRTQKHANPTVGQILDLWMSIGLSEESLLQLFVMRHLIDLRKCLILITAIKN